MPGGEGAIAFQICYRGPFSTERQAIEKKRQTKIAVFQQLKAQFPEVHAGIGDRRRFLLVISEQH